MKWDETGQQITMTLQSKGLAVSHDASLVLREIHSRQLQPVSSSTASAAPTRKAKLTPHAKRRVAP